METREFIKLTRAVVERLDPKLPDMKASHIRSATSAGSWRFAITELTAILVNHQIEVTNIDRDDLQRLLVKLNEPTDDLERLNVTAPTN